MALPQLIRHNFWLKLFSLLLAVLVWFAVYVVRQGNDVTRTFVTSPDTETFYDVAVFVMKQPGDERLFEVSPPSVDVKLTGESAVLRDLTRDDIKVYVDLTARRRRHVLRTEKVRVDLPPNVTLVQILPLAVEIAQSNSQIPNNQPTQKNEK